MKKILFTLIFVCLFANISLAKEAKEYRVILVLTRAPISMDKLRAENAEHEIIRNMGLSQEEIIRRDYGKKYEVERVIYEDEHYMMCTPKARITTAVEVPLDKPYTNIDGVLVTSKLELKEIDNPHYGDPEKIMYIKIDLEKEKQHVRLVVEEPKSKKK